MLETGRANQNSAPVSLCRAISPDRLDVLPWFLLALEIQLHDRNEMN